MANQILIYEDTTCLVCGAKVLFAVGRGAHGVFDEHQLGALDNYRIAMTPHVCPVFEVEEWTRRAELAARCRLRIVTPESPPS